MTAQFSRRTVLRTATVGMAGLPRRSRDVPVPARRGPRRRLPQRTPPRQALRGGEPSSVIGYRTARTLTGGWPPSARDRREYRRMWQEKVEAFTQAAVAAATSAPGPVAAGRALAPVRRRVRGNARRLSRG